VASVKDIDPFAPDTVECPYQFYAAMRQEAPVHHVPGRDIYIVSRYADIEHVLANPEIFSSHGAPGYRPSAEAKAIMAQGWLPTDTLLSNDPPAHRRFRNLVNKAFTPRRVAALEPAIRTIANELVDAFIGAGKAELMRQFAVLLPLIVIADALGVPRANLDDFKRWSDDSVAPMSGMIDHQRELECAHGMVEFQRYFAAQLDSRRSAPRDDILTDLINARLEGERPLDTREMLNMLQQLLVAGNETTTNLIGNAMLLLLERPEHMAALRADRTKIPGLIEEVLRFESPVQGLYRRTKIATELGGVAIPAGARLVLMYASANRDEAHFASADRFDPARENAREHLGFGGGIHYCLGAPLARMESRIAFETILERTRAIRLAPGLNDFTHTPSFALRGLKVLHIEFDPA
jgi:cytochrome P450